MQSVSFGEPGGSAESAARAQGQVPRVALPAMQELPRLHQELGLWMAHTRYQVQPVDRIPIWRVQNTSITLSTGAGVGSFFLLKRFSPSLKFPLDIIPPFIMFYLTHRAAQVWQLPGLYESFLSLSSPLGFKTREILEALRGSGRLPSHEFGTHLPGPRVGGPRPAPGGGPDAAGGGGGGGGGGEGFADFFPAAPGSHEPAVHPGTGSSDGFAPPAADPWSDTGLGGSPAPSWDSTEGGKFPRAPPARKTWDEIRAEQAARQQQQQE